MNWNIIDVAIGMSAIYLVLSVTVSAINELIAAVFSLRANNLAAGIRNIIGAERQATLYAHPLVQAMGLSGKVPSYLPAETFAGALISLITPRVATVAVQTVDTVKAAIAALPLDDSLRPTLTALLDDADNDYAKFKLNVATWYDHAMDRLSGEYKRRMQVFGIAAAIAITLACNVNSLAVFDKLWSDSSMRASIAAAASAPGSQDIAARAKAVSAQLDILTLPIGWHSGMSFSSEAAGTNTIWGWIFTMIAASLGGPFWFDALNRLVNVRSGGPKPEKAAVSAP